MSLSSNLPLPGVNDLIDASCDLMMAELGNSVAPTEGL